MRLIATPALLLVLCAAPACADDAAEAGKKLVAGKPSCDDLLGTTTFGIYFQGQRLGSAKVVLSKAPAGSGAAYQEQAEVSIRMGDKGTKHTQTTLLDGKLSMVKNSEVNTEIEGKTETVETIVTERKGDAYVRTITKDGKTTTLSLKTTENYSDSMTLVSLLAAKTPGKYSFQGISWKEGKPTAQTLSLESKAAAEFEHHGKRVQAVTLLASKGGQPPMKIVVQGAKTLLMAPGGSPIKLIAESGTPKKKSGKKLITVRKGRTTPVSCVRLYLTILAGRRHIDSLDVVVDWEAVLADSKRWDPDTKLTAAQIAKREKARLMLDIPLFDAAKVKSMIAVAETMIVDGTEGEVTKVKTIRGKIKLRKLDDGTWRILKLPH